MQAPHKRHVAVWTASIGAIIVILAGLTGCPPPAPDDDQNGDSGLTGQFAGSTVCALCHANQHSDWSATNHAHALEALEEAGQGDNPLCLGCHTTGFGQDGGFQNLATTASLAGVGCEACHGPSLPHRLNVADVSLRPPIPLLSETCAQCHNPFHHALYEQWAGTAHAEVSDSAAEDFIAGEALNRCGICHSGDYRFWTLEEGLEVSDSFLMGRAVEELAAVECVTCHDPHQRTNRAFLPQPGHDYQLRFAEVVPLPAPSNEIRDVTDPDRYNLCGQCHHAREATWTTTSRPPHHSIQVNYYIGEMPVPLDTDPIVPNQRTVHAFVPKQCVTCHMQFVVEEGLSVLHSNHSFAVLDFVGCSAVGCHPSPEAAEADLVALQTEVEAGLDEIAARLGDPATWEYSATGGPEDQTTVSDTIKQVRFLYYWVLNDGSAGVHNPEYTRSILREADILLDAAGL